jgi:hypothetical protein
MPPRRTHRYRNHEEDEPVNTATTIGSMSQADLAKLIADQIAATIPTIAAMLKADALDQGNNGGSNGGSGMDSGFTGGSGAGCTYNSYLACRPPAFKGIDGATNVIQWIKSVEVVIRRSGCALNQAVTYVTGMFQCPAFTWWNSIISARGADAVDEMLWTDFKDLMLKMFFPRNKIQKLEQEFWKMSINGPAHQEYTTRFQEVSQLVPHLSTPESKWVERYVYGLAPRVRGLTMGARPKTPQEAIEISTTFTDEGVRNVAFGKVEPNDKRKWTNKVNHVGASRNSNTFKRPANAIQSIAAT